MLLRKLNRGVVNITCVQNVRKASNKISDGFGDMKTTDEVDKESTPRELKEWRNIPEWMKPRKKTFHNEDEVTLDRSFMFFSTEAPSKLTFSLDRFSFWLKNTKIANEKSNQKYLEERHMILGPDLAIAHFILFRGGKVQFSGDDKWHTMQENKFIDLPDEYDSAYIVRAVDASGIPLYYEGIQNFCHLPQLKWLSLKGSHIDEWCLDFLSHHLPSLEYLDISNCKRVHERGLEALYKNFNLRTLIVTNHHNSKAFELTCLMLEEVLPHLECIILEPEQEKSEKVDAK